jgi:hypothetical protein
VGQEGGLDGRQVDAEAAGVVEPHVAVRAGVDSTLRAASPMRPVTSTEKPWHATHSWSIAVTRSWPARWIGWVRRISDAISGAWGTPGSTLDRVSVSLSTTTVRTSSSSGFPDRLQHRLIAALRARVARARAGKREHWAGE